MSQQNVIVFLQDTNVSMSNGRTLNSLVFGAYGYKSYLQTIWSEAEQRDYMEKVLDRKKEKPNWSLAEWENFINTQSCTDPQAVTSSNPKGIIAINPRPTREDYNE